MKEQLKKDIDVMVDSLVGKEVTKEQLENLLSLKQQYDAAGKELEITDDQVVKRYKISESWEIVRCKTAIFFHANSFWVVSRPTMANNLAGGALYEMLTWWCDYQDNMEDTPANQREIYDTLAVLVTHIMSLPLDIFADMDMCLDIGKYILERRAEFYEKIMAEQKEREETAEDLAQNEAFEEIVRASDTIADAINTSVTKKRGRKKKVS